jgi:hypothetical protein
MESIKNFIITNTGRKTDNASPNALFAEQISYLYALEANILCSISADK